MYTGIMQEDNGMLFSWTHCKLGHYGVIPAKFVAATYLIHSTNIEDKQDLSEWMAQFNITLETQQATSAISTDKLSYKNQEKHKKQPYEKQVGHG